VKHASYRFWQLLTLVPEARLHFFRWLGYTEADVDALAAA